MSRTAAATRASAAARRDTKTWQLVDELMPRLPEMPQDKFAALAIAVLGELERRAAGRVDLDRAPAEGLEDWS